MYILCNIDIYIYIYILPSASACLSVAWQTWPRSRSQLLPKNLVLFAKWKQKNHRKCLRRTIKNTRWKKENEDTTYEWKSLWFKWSLHILNSRYPYMSHGSTKCWIQYIYNYLKSTWGDMLSFFARQQLLPYNPILKISLHLKHSKSHK